MTETDYVAILQFARIGAAYVYEDIMDELDITDEEFTRVSNLIHNELSKTQGELK